MDAETVDYLITYYFHLLPNQWQKELQHVRHSEKVAAIDDATVRAKMQAVYLRCGWLSADDEVVALLQDGVPSFRWRLATKIYGENGGDSLLNNCPVCSRLTRTPTAKQCRHCGAKWHDSQVVFGEGLD